MTEHEADPGELKRRLEETELELEQFRMTLEVTGVFDLDAGILNRNGLLDALERGRRWLTRRGDLYGALVVVFPRLTDIDADTELLRHLAATMGAGVREVDEVGRLDEQSFAAVLNDLQADSLNIVAERVTSLAYRVAHSVTVLGGEALVGGVEVHSTGRTGESVLEAAYSLAESARPGKPNVVRI